MADKDFKVKNKLFVNGLSHNSGVILATNNNLDAHTNVPTQYGGTGTTTSPNAGEVLYSTSGSTYAPSNLATLVQSLAPDEVTYSSSAPSSPVVGQVWIDSDSEFGSFDPNIIRRQSFTATAGQTIFTTAVSFAEGYEQVYFNGLLLLRTTDYTTSGGNTVTLLEEAAAGDIVEVVSVTNLNSVNTYTQAEINSALALKANLASPTFTGTVVLPNNTVTNSMLANSSITINGSPVSLGGSLSGFSTLTGLETLTNKSLTSANLTGTTKIEQIIEKAGTGVYVIEGGTWNHDVLTSNAIAYTSVEPQGNLVLNIRGDFSTTLNSVMQNQQSLTIVFAFKNASSPKYITGFQIDGTTRTVNWQGGSAPTAGNANSIDVYSFTIWKTDNNTFTVLGSLTRFA